MDTDATYDEYYLVRLVPDLAMGEFLNVGVVVISRSSQKVVARVLEAPDSFAKVPAIHHRVLRRSLQQFLALLQGVDGFHKVSAGLHEGEYREETDVRLTDYTTGVGGPLALSQPRRCNAASPLEMAEMLYKSLVLAPYVPEGFPLRGGLEG